ncbi:unnamed protein product, partial [Vitis vinifera]
MMNIFLAKLWRMLASPLMQHNMEMLGGSSTIVVPLTFMPKMSFMIMTTRGFLISCSLLLKTFLPYRS